MHSDTCEFIVGPSSAERCRPWRQSISGLLLGLLLLDGTRAAERSVPDSIVVKTADACAASNNAKVLNMWMNVGERRFAVTLADTEAARAFAARLPLTLDMTDLNGNEKKVDLPKALPADAGRPGTIRSGDLMLYGTNTVVVFYLTFDSPYSYTRLGRVDEPNGLEQALGQNSAKVKFTQQ